MEEYFLKFTLLYKHVPSLVSNLRDETSRFVTCIANLVKEECRTDMLHNDMTPSMLIMYAQSIEESNIERKCRCVK